MDGEKAGFTFERFNIDENKINGSGEHSTHGRFVIEGCFLEAKDSDENDTTRKCEFKFTFTETDDTVKNRIALSTFNSQVENIFSKKDSISVEDILNQYKTKF